MVIPIVGDNLDLDTTILSVVVSVVIFEDHGFQYN